MSAGMCTLKIDVGSVVVCGGLSEVGRIIQLEGYQLTEQYLKVIPILVPGIWKTIVEVWSWNYN
jgi:hypothetical protein